MPDKPNHRHLYKRTSISGSTDDLRRRRVAINTTLRKKHREQLITSKRFRHLTRREEQSASESEDDAVPVPDQDGKSLSVQKSKKWIDNETFLEEIDPYYRLTEAQVDSLAQDLKAGDKKTRMDAIQYLGKFAVEPAKALVAFIVEGDCMDTLTVSDIDPPCMAHSFLFFSICCQWPIQRNESKWSNLYLVRSSVFRQRITHTGVLFLDIAAGSYNLWSKSTCSVPHLINLLDAENSVLREMSAGALGNMAAEDMGDMTEEDDEVRARIRNNGAIPPLVRMLDSEVTKNWEKEPHILT